MERKSHPLHWSKTVRKMAGCWPSSFSLFLFSLTLSCLLQYFPPPFFPVSLPPSSSLACRMSKSPFFLMQTCLLVAGLFRSVGRGERVFFMHTAPPCLYEQTAALRCRERLVWLSTPLAFRLNLIGLRHCGNDMQPVIVVVVTRISYTFIHI